MKATRETKKIAKSLFRACFTDGQYDREKALKQLQALDSAAPRNHLAILQEFRRLVRIEEAKQTAHVETATVLSNALCGKIVAQIQKRYGTATTVYFTANPSLIGGIRIKVGSDVWDASLTGCLDRLKQEFQQA